jgi:hypothetical protein
MASRFIAYVPKPTKEKQGSKPLYKSGNSWQIKRNLVPIRVPAIDSDLLAQKHNRGNKIIVKGILIQPIFTVLILIEVESLTKVCNSNNNNNKDSNDSELPLIHKIRLSY